MKRYRSDRPDRLDAERAKKKRDKKKQFTKSMQQKLAFTFGVIMLALFALIFKIHLIQRHSREYNQKVLMQQRYDSRDIPYRRGDILDRNGILLATSNKVYNVIIDANQINSRQENYLEPTVALLSEVFGSNEEEIRTLLVEKSESRYIKYKKEVSFEDKERFEKREEEINAAFRKGKSKQRVYGIWFEESYKRIYPYNTLACNVMGFVNEDEGVGFGGVEQYYNEKLVGVKGREYGYLNEESNLERVIKPSEGGNNLALTIDSNIQKIVEKHIAKWDEEVGSKITACIIMNPNNGEILALASSKSFDLNKPRDLSMYYSEEELSNMDDAKKTDILNNLWRNFCVNDTFEPGSPSKIFTVAAALEEGIIEGNESYYCDGYQRVGGHDIHCAVRSGHGMITVSEAVARSCNDVMMQLVSSLGTAKFSKAQHLFGFGVHTGIDLPGEPDTYGLVHNTDNMSAVDLATNSFGQNFNCNMIQMAAAFCSVINGGSYYEPHVVKKIFNEQGVTIETIEPKLVRETVSPATSDFLKKAMRMAVEEGTGKSAQVAGYDVGGKTGISEKLPRGNGKYLVSFGGFAPVDDPEVFCYVVVDEPLTEDQASSSYAGQLFAKIMEDVMPYMSIFPKEGYEGEIKNTQEQRRQETANENSPVDEEGNSESTQSGERNYETDEYIEFDNLSLDSSDTAQGGVNEVESETGETQSKAGNNQ